MGTEFYAGLVNRDDAGCTKEACRILNDFFDPPDDHEQKLTPAEIDSLHKRFMDRHLEPVKMALREATQARLEQIEGAKVLVRDYPWAEMFIFHVYEKAFESPAFDPQQDCGEVQRDKTLKYQVGALKAKTYLPSAQGFFVCGSGNMQDRLTETLAQPRLLSEDESRAFYEARKKAQRIIGSFFFNYMEKHRATAQQIIPDKAQQVIRVTLSPKKVKGKKVGGKKTSQCLDSALQEMAKTVQIVKFCRKLL